MDLLLVVLLQLRHFLLVMRFLGTPEDIPFFFDRMKLFHFALELFISDLISSNFLLHGNNLLVILFLLALELAVIGLVFLDPDHELLLQFSVDVFELSDLDHALRHLLLLYLTLHQLTLRGLSARDEHVALLLL